jgi:hypothetical protein
MDKLLIVGLDNDQICKVLEFIDELKGTSTVPIMEQFFLDNWENENYLELLEFPKQEAKVVLGYFFLAYAKKYKIRLNLVKIGARLGYGEKNLSVLSRALNGLRIKKTGGFEKALTMMELNNFKLGGKEKDFVRNLYEYPHRESSSILV